MAGVQWLLVVCSTLVWSCFHQAYGAAADQTPETQVLPPSALEMKSTVVCEGQRAFISCDNVYNEIQIESTMYGRKNPSICVHPKIPSSTFCQEQGPEVKSQIKGLCENEYKCEVTASDESLAKAGTVICPTVYKYLMIKYRCVPKVPFPDIDDQDKQNEQVDETVSEVVGAHSDQQDEDVQDASVAEESVDSDDSVAEKSVESDDSVTEKSVDSDDSVTEKSVDSDDSVTEKSVESDDSVTEKSVDSDDSVTGKSVDSDDSVTETPVDSDDSVTETPVNSDDSVTEKSVESDDSVTEEPVDSSEASQDVTETYQANAKGGGQVQEIHETIKKSMTEPQAQESDEETEEEQQQHESGNEEDEQRDVTYDDTYQK